MWCVCKHVVHVYYIHICISILVSLSLSLSLCVCVCVCVRACMRVQESEVPKGRVEEVQTMRAAHLARQQWLNRLNKGG